MEKVRHILLQYFISRVVMYIDDIILYKKNRNIYTKLELTIHLNFANPIIKLKFYDLCV